MSVKSYLCGTVPVQNMLTNSPVENASVQPSNGLYIETVSMDPGRSRVSAWAVCQPPVAGDALTEPLLVGPPHQVCGCWWETVPGDRCDHPRKMVVYHTNEVPLRPANAGNASYKCIAKTKRRRRIGEAVSALPTQGLQQTRSSSALRRNEREHREEQPFAVVLMETVSPSAQATMAGPPAWGQPDGLLRNISQQLDVPMAAAAQAPETMSEPALLLARGNLRGVARYGKAVRR